MNSFNYGTGGFPLTTDRLRDMQEGWQQVAKALTGAITGGGTSLNCVVSGCGNLKTSPEGDEYYDFTSSGWVIIRGELLPFVVDEDTEGVAIVVEEDTNALSYQDGGQHTYKTSRYAVRRLSYDSNNLSIEDFYPDPIWQGKLNLLEVWKEKASNYTVDTNYNKLANRLTKLEQKISALDATFSAGDTNLSEALSRLDSSLKNQLVPRGTLVMTLQQINEYPQTIDELIESLGDFYGYVPAADYDTGKALKVLDKPVAVWNEYFSRLGLPAEARLNVNTTFYFSLVIEKCGLRSVSMDNAYPVGYNTFRADSTNDRSVRMAGDKYTVDGPTNVNVTFLVKVI